MQQIERYGVIALVFLLVTIVAVSFWGDSKSPGFWSRLTGKGGDKKEQVQTAVAPVASLDHVTDPNAPLAPTTTPPQTPNNLVDLGAPSPTPNATDAPGKGVATIQSPPPSTGPIVVNTPPSSGNFVPATPGNSGIPIKPAPTTRLAPAATDSTEYVVQKGDSLARIAAQKLGSENRWTEIVALNPGLEPRNLSVGKSIKLPSSTASVAKTPTTSSAPNAPGLNDKKLAAAPKPEAKKIAKETAIAPKSSSSGSSSTYIVQKGDHMTTIAQKELGDARRWKEIVAANPGLDPNKLAVGEKLKMPGAKHEAPIVASTPKSTPASAVKEPLTAKSTELAVAEKPHVR